MLSENEKNRIKNKLKKEFPECIKCPHLEVENVEKGQVHCFYRVKDKCILNRQYKLKDKEGG